MPQPLHELPTDSFPVASVGGEDGVPPEASVLASLARLELEAPFQIPLPCYPCGKQSNFLVQFILPSGWWGVCLSCGDERRVPYTRTVEE